MWLALSSNTALHPSSIPAIPALDPSPRGYQLMHGMHGMHGIPSVR
jgi:hypothetical protein